MTIPQRPEGCFCPFGCDIHDHPTDNSIGWLISEYERLKAQIPQWREMASAPKDGRDILLMGGKNSGRWIRTGYWARRTGGWCVDVVGGSGFDAPTYWCPLPALPKEATDGR